MRRWYVRRVTSYSRGGATCVSAGHAGALFVVADDGRAIGVVTDRDFAKKVVAEGMPGESPVASIMSSPVVAVEGGDRIFQALLAMLGRDIHHVLVTENGLPKGVLTSHDLMVLQGKSPLSLARHLEQQQTLDDLAAAQKRIGDLLPLLMREGARASHITRVVAELNDRVTAKILELAEKKLGPASGAVLLGGDGQRGPPRADVQDRSGQRADLCRCGGGRACEAPRNISSALAEFVADGLERCGYPRCTGGYMASNPRYRLSLSAWQKTFDVWIEEAEYHATEDASILFDMRPAAGDSRLFEKLWSQVVRTTEDRQLLQVDPGKHHDQPQASAGIFQDVRGGARRRA